MNIHRGSDFNDFMIEQGIMTPTPRTDAIAHQGLGSVAYIARMTSLGRELERELAAASDQLTANHEATRLMGKWLEAERELADRLAGVLLSYDSDMLAGHDMEWLPEHDETLTAWKEARRGTV